MDWSKNPLTNKPKPSKSFNQTAQNFIKPKKFDKNFNEERSPLENRQIETDTSSLNPISKQNFEKFLKLFEEKVQNVASYSDKRSYSKSSSEKYRSNRHII
jgi:hypothetical protein